MYSMQLVTTGLFFRLLRDHSLQFPSNFSAAPSLVTVQNCLSIFNHTLYQVFASSPENPASDGSYSYYLGLDDSNPVFQPGLSLDTQPDSRCPPEHAQSYLSLKLKAELRLFPTNPDDLLVLPTGATPTPILTAAQ